MGVACLYAACILCIVLFQRQVHSFHQSFHRTQTLTQNISSRLLNQSMTVCNGPLFSSPLSNVLVMPFSVLLLGVFSLTRREEMQPSWLGAKHHQQQSRHHRFFSAALYCLLAHEIFRMLESSLLFESSSTGGLSFDNMSASSPLLASVNETQHTLESGAKLVRIGLGLETTRSGPVVASTLQQRSATSLLVFEPLMLRYSKPRLPPRLNWKNFETTTAATTPSTTAKRLFGHKLDGLLLGSNELDGDNDANLTRSFEANLNLTRQGQSKINAALNKTLFEVCF